MYISYMDSKKSNYLANLYFSLGQLLGLVKRKESRILYIKDIAIKMIIILVYIAEVEKIDDELCLKEYMLFELNRVKELFEQLNRYVKNNFNNNEKDNLHKALTNKKLRQHVYTTIMKAEDVKI